jgi:tRNA(fMet)-specific endonuclease VapC
MFVLDTDVYTHLLKDHPKVMEYVSQAKAQRELVATTILTKIEVLRGRFEALLKADDRGRFFTAQRHLVVTEEALRRILVLPLDDGALDQFERLRQAKGLKRIGRVDLLIASIALARQATLVTRNLKHFRLVPNLRLENWMD